MDYHVCWGKDLDELEKSVGDFLRLGYTPQGGVFAVVAGGSPLGWYQAMLKPEAA